MCKDLKFIDFLILNINQIDFSTFKFPQYLMGKIKFLIQLTQITNLKLVISYSF